MRLILQRYLAFNFILPLALSTLFFVSFLLTFQLFRVTKLIASKDVPLMSIFELMGHISLTFLPIGIPLSVLFATLHTYGKLGQDSELIAMRSLGLTKGEIFLPVLLLSALLAMALFGLNQNLIPMANQKFKFAMTALSSKGLLSNIKKGQFFTDVPKVLLFAEDVKGDDLYGVFLKIEGEDNFQSIHAQKALIEKSNDAEWGSTSMNMIFFDGNLSRFSKEGEQFEKINFKKYFMPLVNESFNLDFAPRETMKSGGELYKDIKNWKGDKRSSKDFFQLKLEFFNRFNSPLLILVFSFVGLGLGVQRARGKNQNTATMALMILVLYYLLYFSGLSLAKEGKLWPEVAVFIPTIIMASIGAWLYKRLDWVI